jgi:hypothetical protein
MMHSMDRETPAFPYVSPGPVSLLAFAPAGSEQTSGPKDEENAATKTGAGENN